MVEIKALARRDLKSIYKFGVKQFGKQQAIKYQRGLEALLLKLEATPAIWRPVPKTKLPYFRVNYQSHAIFFRKEAEVLVIIRVLNQRMEPLLHLPEK